MLRADPEVTAPDLPDRHDQPWHQMTVAWWGDIWSSPMAPEFDESDQHGLFALAVLVDDFWSAETPRERRELAAEIRQQGQRFGLSPIDRRRLQWEIERADSAQDRGTRRRAGRAPAEGSSSEAAADPRDVLRLA